MKNTKNTMRIHWQTVKLDSVLQHYVDGFKIKSGEEVVYSSEWFLDQAKGQIVFKLIIDRSKPPKS